MKTAQPRPGGRFEVSKLGEQLMQAAEGQPPQPTPQQPEVAQPETASAVEIPEPIKLALAMLLESRKYARTVRRSTWEFAVEIEQLQADGLTNDVLRYLVCTRLAEHAVEITPRKSRRRVFRRLHNLMIPDKTCFVATKRGEAVALEAKLSGANPSRRAKGELASNGNGTSNGNSLRPEWRRDRRELWVGNVLVKSFMVPAPMQETILAAFEEEDWPSRIDDPLPPCASIDPKRRLHDGIMKLNRNQTNWLLYFRGDGTGSGVRWEFKSD